MANGDYDFNRGRLAHEKWGNPIARDLSGVEQLRTLRGVKSFEEMPLHTQRVYLEISRCFPGVQIWAVGSRVRGDYVEPGDGEFVREARKAAGMKDKSESDFDFLAAPDAVQTGELPKGAERVRCRVPENERIEIPVFKGVANFANNGLELAKTPRIRTPRNDCPRRGRAVVGTCENV